MNGARLYEKFEGARNHKQLGLLKHALAFNNEKRRTTEVKESSLAIVFLVSVIVFYCVVISCDEYEAHLGLL